MGVKPPRRFQMKTSLSNTFSTLPHSLKSIHPHTHPHTPSRRKAEARGVQNLTGLPGPAPPSAKVQRVCTAASLSSRRDCTHSTRPVDECKCSVVPGFWGLGPASSPTGKISSPAWLLKTSLSSPAQQMGSSGVSFSPTLHREALQWTLAPELNISERILSCEEVSALNRAGRRRGRRGVEQIFSSNLQTQCYPGG